MEAARPPSIVMKMDIEGSELVVLERMHSVNVLCQLSMVTFEYHLRVNYSASPALFDTMIAGMDPHVRATILKQRTKHKGLVRLLEGYALKQSRRHDGAGGEGTANRKGTVEATATCATRFDPHDDESYLYLRDTPLGQWL